MQDFKTVDDNILVKGSDVKDGTFIQELSETVALRIEAFRKQVQPGPMIMAEVTCALTLFYAVCSFFNDHPSEPSENRFYHLRIVCRGRVENEVNVVHNTCTEVADVIAKFLHSYPRVHEGIDVEEESRGLMRHILAVYDDPETALNRALTRPAIVIHFEDEMDEYREKFEELDSLAEELSKRSGQLMRVKDRLRRMYSTLDRSSKISEDIEQTVKDVRLGKRKRGDICSEYLQDAPPRRFETA